MTIGKLPPIKSVYERRRFDRDPDWLAATPPALRGLPADQRPDWLAGDRAGLRRRLAARLDAPPAAQPLKGYTFPDVTMWPKVWPALAITFQEWLAGTYGEDVDAAMRVLQQRMDTEYKRRQRPPRPGGPARRMSM